MEGKCRFVKSPQGSLAVRGSVFKLRDPVAPSFVELHHAGMEKIESWNDQTEMTVEKSVR